MPCATSAATRASPSSPRSEPTPVGGPCRSSASLSRRSSAARPSAVETQLISPGQGSVGPTYGGGSGLRELRPAGVPVTDQVVAVQSAVTGDGGRETVTSLVVVVPDGATQVSALGDDGSELATLPVEDGAAVGPFPDGTASVEVQFADGRPPVTSPLGTFTGEF